MDPLQRFLDAQEYCYENAKAEVKQGKKQSHWMWYIFPQLKGLGYSSHAQFYGIKDAQEALAYLQHPILGQRLREMTGILCSLERKDPFIVFGYPDHLKLRSCMTLFYCISEEVCFKRVLEEWFHGEKDEWTMYKLQENR